MNSLLKKSTIFLQSGAFGILFLLLCTSQSFSQGTGYLEVVGSVYQASKGLEGAEILEKKNDKKV